jgi:tetratricopeptide (TPR) repeat protein
MKAFDRSVAALSKVIDLDDSSTSNQRYNALFYRALAYLNWEKLTESRADYETLQKAFPTAHKIYMGLGEIAFRQKDTNAAVRNYRLCLANLRTNMPEARLVTDRLKELHAVP